MTNVITSDNVAVLKQLFQTFIAMIEKNPTVVSKSGRPKKPVLNQENKKRPGRHKKLVLKRHAHRTSTPGKWGFRTSEYKDGRPTELVFGKVLLCKKFYPKKGNYYFGVSADGHLTDADWLPAKARTIKVR